MSTHTIDPCPACGARRVAEASACWQCGVTFATLPTAPASRLSRVKFPWAGVIPFGLFFLPWVIAGRYGVYRVVTIAGLELALGRTLRGQIVPYEPLLWLIPVVSLALGALLFRAYRQASGPRHWLPIAIIAWAGFLLMLIKAVQWLWTEPSPETIWVIHWLTSEYLASGAAFLVSALAATRMWLDLRNLGPQSSSSPSQDTPIDRGEIG